MVSLEYLIDTLSLMPVDTLDLAANDPGRPIAPLMAEFKRAATFSFVKRAEVELSKHANHSAHNQRVI